MKILHTVEFYEPSKGGSQEVVKQLSEHMVAMGHEVTVATTKLADRANKDINGVKIVEFDISGNILTGYTGQLDEYKQFLLDSSYDVVMNYAAQNWSTDLFFEVMTNVHGKKVFVPCGFSHLYTPECKSYFGKMPNILKSYDATVYLSNSYRDIDFARKHKVQNIHIIPNGADEREFSKKVNFDVRSDLRVSPDATLIYQGGTSFTSLKGQLDAIKIFQQSDINNATLLLNGNVIDKKYAGLCKRQVLLHNLNPANRKLKKLIRMRHWDRERTVAAFQQSDVFLFPSNIEASPIVLYESCASSTPFLTNDVGNSAEIIKWTGGGMLLPTTKDEHGYSHAIIDRSAQMLTNLVIDKAMQNGLAKSGHKAWLNKFSWQKISEQYLELYKEVLTR